MGTIKDKIREAVSSLIIPEAECKYTVEAGRQYAYREIIELIDSMSEEPISENLEEEFNRFLNDVEGAPRMWHSDEQMEWGKYIARHFSNWQKQQMMKNAQEMIVGYWMPNGLMLNVDESENDFGINENDRVKVIITKED